MFIIVFVRFRAIIQLIVEDLLPPLYETGRETTIKKEAIALDRGEKHL